MKDFTWADTVRVYLIEFGDGTSLEIPESWIEAVTRS
jgi:hypothetical protein